MHAASHLQYGSELAPPKEEADEKTNESRKADETPDNLKRVIAENEGRLIQCAYPKHLKFSLYWPQSSVHVRHLLLW